MPEAKWDEVLGRQDPLRRCMKLKGKKHIHFIGIGGIDRKSVV